MNGWACALSPQAQTYPYVVSRTLLEFGACCLSAQAAQGMGPRRRLLQERSRSVFERRQRKHRCAHAWWSTTHVGRIAPAHTPPHPSFTPQKEPFSITFVSQPPMWQCFIKSLPLLCCYFCHATPTIMMACHTPWVMPCWPWSPTSLQLLTA